MVLRSAALLCSQTPSFAASAKGIFCANSATIMPVSTSPIPPLAIPGFPCKQTAISFPSSTKVPAPLSTTTPP
ncbi:Uncharacterised protein [Vibrio cholerae]|nr:Uncharacterised protein [Vibrio cholerae]CSB75855.1 Uncharacterised protein [Vibrio cholerae]